MNNNTKNKNLLKGTAIYGIGTFGTKILSFLIVPLYTYYIATEDMGVYDVIISTINLLTPIVTMQISDAAYRWIIRDDVLDKDRYIRSTIQVLVTNCMLASLIILVINQFCSIPYVFYFCIVLILSRSYQTVHKILRGLKNQKLFAVSGLIYTIVFLSLNLIQLCYLHYGVESLFQSAIVANIVALLVIVVFEPGVRVNYFKMPDLKLIGELYKYSIPLVPNYLNWWMISSSDRYIILFALGSSANGVLSISHKFPSVLQSVLALFTNSWQDLSVADMEKDTGIYYTGVFRKYYRFVFSFLWCLIPLTKIVIILIMSEAYKSACNYVAFYYLGTVFQSFASFYGVGYLRSMKTGKAFSTSVFGAIVNIIVNVIFVNFIGIQAAAFSTFVGFLVMWLIREHENRKELGIQIKWIEFLILTVSAVVVSIISNYMDILTNMGLFILGGVLFLIYNRKDLKTVLETCSSKIRKIRH